MCVRVYACVCMCVCVCAVISNLAKPSIERVVLMTRTNSELDEVKMLVVLVVQPCINYYHAKSNVFTLKALLSFSGPCKTMFTPFQRS